MSATTATGRATKSALLGLHALTSLHPGSGTALGAVDLPVQRERHTGWPTIAGSALKGVLRDAMRESVKKDHNGDRAIANRDNANLVALFGKPDSEAAGACSITDARLAAFPVRSAKGVFAWVTCPAVLERLRRDAEMARVEVNTLFVRGPETVTGAVFPQDSPCAIDSTQLLLEEFEFGRDQGDLSLTAKWLADNLLPATPSFEATRSRIEKHLVVLTDNWFTHFAQHATEISARIALDYQTKTVKDGALFYQEFLPTETILYSVAIVNESRSGNGNSANDLLTTLTNNLPSTLQIGGDETTGKGYCATRLKGGS